MQKENLIQWLNEGATPIYADLGQVEVEVNDIHNNILYLTLRTNSPLIAPFQLCKVAVENTKKALKNDSEIIKVVARCELMLGTYEYELPW